MFNLDDECLLLTQESPSIFLTHIININVNTNIQILNKQDLQYRLDDT